MRKKLILATVFVFLFSSIVGLSDTYSKDITAWFYDIKVYVDETAVSLSAPPFIYNGRVYAAVDDLAQGFGYESKWIHDSKRMYVTSKTKNTTDLDTVKTELEQKNKEIENLRSKLEIAMVSKGNKEVPISALNDVKAVLAEKYGSYSHLNRRLSFSYDVTQLPDDTIRVKLYGDFERGSNVWTGKNNSDFRNFIVNICEEFDRITESTLEVIIYDKNRERSAEYTYDDIKNRLYENYIYGSSNNYILNNISMILEDNYGQHINKERTMKFKYNVARASNSKIEVKMYGNFHKASSHWEGRDAELFKSFVSQICLEFDRKLGEELAVMVYDSSETLIIEYTYSPVSGKVERKY